MRWLKAEVSCASNIVVRKYGVTMRKHLTVLAGFAACLASIMLQVPMAHAQPGDTLVPDDALAECFASAIGDATGTTPEWQIYGITQIDIDAWAAAGGVSNEDGFGCSGVTDLTGIDNLPFTESSDRDLYLGDGSITDLRPLSGLTNLWGLNLSYNDIANIAPLAGLTNLTELYMQGNRISDLSPLAGMSDMSILMLYNNRISNVAPLAGMAKLSELDFGFNNVKSVAPLAWMSGLRHLYFNGNPIADANALATMSHLAYLGIGSTGISDVSWLAGMTGLRDLDLSNNGISDISALTKLIKLDSLYAQNNKISDISALAGLTKLTDVALGGNPLGDLSPLAGLKQIYSLGLSNTGISDLSSLASFIQKTSNAGIEIDVSGNHVMDLSPLHLCTQAQVEKDDLTGCAMVDAQLQTMEQAAITGVPQALPLMIGQADDPPQWTITQGTPQPVIADGQVTFSAPGTYVLQFQDQPMYSGDTKHWFDLTSDFCAQQNGTWTDDSNQCAIVGDFTGIVTYTVSLPAEEPTTPSDTPTIDDTPATSDSTGGSALIGGLIAGGVVLVGGSSAILIWWRRRGRHEVTQQAAA